jgi:N6-adenosine-specific RNA methylase IME4/ParB-like chromosome segregation protein Spo0J
MTEEERGYHEVANIFPLLNGQEYEDLKADIAANGLLEPIWLHRDGRIIDGRNRHRACIDTGTPPQFRTWNGRGSLVSFVVSLNLHRRHLTSSQRAAAVVETLPMYEAEARERMSVASANKGKEIFPTLEQGQARDQAGAAVGVSGRYVSDAKRLAEDAPELFEQVKAGEITIPQAKRIHNHDTKTEPPPMAGKYRIIYADPPWSYNNSGFEQSAAQHYPTMTTEEICGLPVGDIADAPSVLYLWATVPLLPDALRVMDAWGFEYKSNRVWIKDRAPGIGWWLRTYHELLLIGTRGGNLHPSERLDSILTLPVENHSKKPEAFRADIARVHEGPFIELFAREAHDGWSTWGNEDV